MVHHIVTEVRSLLKKYSQTQSRMQRVDADATLPPKLYRLLALLYRAARAQDLLSALLLQASEDGALDKPVRDLVMASLSTNTPTSQFISKLGRK
jgi:hypothetical protein